VFRVPTYTSRPHRVALIAFPLLPLYLPIVYLMEGFTVSTSRSSRRVGSSFASSSRTTGKAPAVSQKRVSQPSGSRRRKRQKTNPEQAPAEPLTYHEVESDSEPEPQQSRGPEQPRFEVHGQWYRRCEDLASKKKPRTKSSHIWGEGKGYAIVHEASGVRYYYCCQCLDEKKDPTYKPLCK
jgi:hypothetical protein